MDGFAMGFSSSTTIKPPEILKLTTPGGTDENEKNFDKMAPELDNPLNNSPIKHFLPSTVSVVSKGSVPRKKILAERNEASNFTYTPNLDSKTTPLCVFDSSDPYSIRVSQFDGDEHNTCVFGSSSPYDPLTNYLPPPPRPKFLRYKPNRRREIFIGQENYSEREKDGSGVKSSVCLYPQRDFVTQLDEENVTGNEKDDVSGVKSSACLVSEKVQSSQEDKETGGENPEKDSDDVIEEFEKRNFFILSLLIFVILSLSTTYICSMNHPTHSWTPQATWGVKYGYQQIQNHSSNVNFENLEGRGRSVVQIEWTQVIIHDGFEEEVSNEEKIKGLVERADEVIGVVDEEEKQVTRTEYAEDGYENEESEVVTYDNLAIANEFSESVIEAADGISLGKVDSVTRFSVVIVIVTLLSLLGFVLWTKQFSLPVEKQLSESVLVQKPTIVDPVVVPIMEGEHVEKVVVGVNSSLGIRSMEETTQKLNKIWAPTVELLAEIDMSSDPNFLQNSPSYGSFTPVKPSASDFSTMNSPSYGSFSAEKNVKKKDGKGGEAKTSVTISVRRSGRIRNRGAP